MAHLVTELLLLLCVTSTAALRARGRTYQASGLNYPWAGKNGNPARTGTSGSVAPRVLTPGPSWSFHDEEEAPFIFSAYPALRARFPSFYGLTRATPLIDDQLNVYLSMVTTGTIYKFSPDGTFIWSHRRGLGQQLPGVPAIMDGLLFSATVAGEAFAIDMETGVTKWSSQVAPNLAADAWSVAAGEGVVIIPTINAAKGTGNNNQLVALRASDGQVIWKFDPESDLVNVQVSIRDGACLFSAPSGKVYRVDLQSGTALWQSAKPATAGFTTGGTVLAPDGRTAFASWNQVTWDGHNLIPYGMVGAFDVESGSKLWESFVEYEAHSAPVVGQTGSGNLSVIIGVGTNPDSPDPARNISSGVGPEKKARLVALDANTGARSWAYELPPWHGSALGDDLRPDPCHADAFSNAAIGGDGTVYVGTASGLLYSIRDDDGNHEIASSEVSSYQTGAAMQGSPAIAAGMLAVVPCDGLHVWRLNQTASLKVGGALVELTEG